MINTVKLISKIVQLQVRNNVLNRELAKLNKKLNKTKIELKEMVDNNIFLIDENEILKKSLRKYVKEEDDEKGKVLKKALDKKMEVKSGK